VPAEDEVPLGEQPPSAPGQSGKSSSARRRSPAPSKPPSPAPSKVSKPPSPTPSKKPSQLKQPPKAASDSDVRLVMDAADMDFRLDEEKKSPPPAGSDSAARKTKPVNDEKPIDSGPRILPLDESSDSDVKIEPDAVSDSNVPLDAAKRLGPSDSDIRLEDLAPPPGKRQDQVVTEEIDLDAEAARAEQQPKGPKPKPRIKSKVKPTPNLPTESPFELSEDDLNLETPKRDRKPGPTPPDKADVDSSDDFELAPEKDSSDDFELAPKKDSSEDFELTPKKESSDDFELTPGSGDDVPRASSGEVPVLAGDDSIDLGAGGSGPSASGINLQDPADSGISLESGNSDEIEFELTLPTEGSTPKPASAAPKEEGVESSSEFELSLGDDSSSSVEEPSESDSEFELSLDVDADQSDELKLEKVAAEDEGSGSDSEFELTLDEGEAPESDALAESGEEKDIFETDFEVPALEDESGSEAVALEGESDTDLEGSSDFELSLTDEDVAEEESESEVVELDDEESAAPAARGRSRSRVPAAEDEELEVAVDEEGLDLEVDLEAEEEAEIEEEEEEETAAVAAPPAEWGAMPGIVLMFSCVFLFLILIMGFELVQSSTNYTRAGPVTGMLVNPLARLLDKDVPQAE
jgi:hypothetical protein